MTESFPFRRFDRAWSPRLGVCALIAMGASALPACAGAQVATQPTGAASPVGGASPGRAVNLDPDEAQFTLSSPQAVDGSLVAVNANLPKGMDGKALRAEFGATSAPFFPIPSHGPQAWQALVGIPANHKPGSLPIRVRMGIRTWLLPFEVQVGAYKREELKVAPKHVNPPKREMARIMREIAEAGQIYGQVTESKLWNGAFAFPIDSPVTSPYGSSRIYNGKLANFHSGLDLKAPTGTPIHAPAPGKVVLAKRMYYTGWTVMLDHGYGVITLYAHMSKLKVRLGDMAPKGAVLGLSGATGRVTGPHLHWAAIVHKVKVNPLDLTHLSD